MGSRGRWVGGRVGGRSRRAIARLKCAGCRGQDLAPQGAAGAGIGSAMEIHLVVRDHSLGRAEDR